MPHYLDALWLDYHHNFIHNPASFGGNCFIFGIKAYNNILKGTEYRKGGNVNETSLAGIDHVLGHVVLFVPLVYDPAWNIQSSEIGWCECISVIVF